MKKIFLFLCTLFAFLSQSQTPHSIMTRSSDSKNDFFSKSASLNNVWIGSKVTGILGSSDDFSDNIIVSGKVLYNIPVTKTFNLPIVSNISLNLNKGNFNAFLTGDQGISIGVFPYKVIKSSTDYDLVIHGGVSYKLLPLDSTSLKLTPKQTKIFAGFEISKNIKEGLNPLTFSVTPAYFINNLDKKNYFAIETTAIMPVSPGLGVLAELLQPMASAPYNSVFKIGFILSGPSR